VGAPLRMKKMRAPPPPSSHPTCALELDLHGPRLMTTSCLLTPATLWLMATEMTTTVLLQGPPSPTPPLLMAPLPPHAAVGAPLPSPLPAVGQPLLLLLACGHKSLS
jgi:hypothetical protein